MWRASIDPRRCLGGYEPDGRLRPIEDVTITSPTVTPNRLARAYFLFADSAGSRFAIP